jgi:hypothetical protein
MPIGEQNLVKALIKAAQANGARYVHSYNDGTGWHTYDAKPYGVTAYFRVSGQKVWIRTAQKAEILVATVVDGRIVPEESAAKFFAG